MDPTLKTIVEFRDEMREFRVETRKTLAEHSHRLNVIEATIASLKADVGILLSSVPVIWTISKRAWPRWKAAVKSHGFDP